MHRSRERGRSACALEMAATRRAAYVSQIQQTRGRYGGMRQLHVKKFRVVCVRGTVCRGHRLDDGLPVRLAFRMRARMERGLAGSSVRVRPDWTWERARAGAGGPGQVPSRARVWGESVHRG